MIQEQMGRVAFKDYAAQLGQLKLRHKSLLTNLFLPTRRMQEQLAQPVFYWHDEENILLGIPVHEQYIRLYYHTASTAALKAAVCLFLTQCNVLLPLVCDVVGPKRRVEEVSPALCENKFELLRRLRRSNVKNNRNYAPLAHHNAEFAREDDAEELFSMIQEQFDVYMDQLPTIDELRERIRDRQVILVRYENRIAGFDYFEIQGHSFHGRLGMVRKEFRQTTTYLELGAMVYSLFEQHKIIRAYGWRNDGDAQRQAVYKLIGEIPEDMYSYIFFHSPVN